MGGMSGAGGGGDLTTGFTINLTGTLYYNYQSANYAEIGSALGYITVGSTNLGSVNNSSTSGSIAVTKGQAISMTFSNSSNMSNFGYSLYILA
jgi:hypothetical protein